MLVDVDENKKIVYYYLSREERDNKEFRESLKPSYKEWKEKGYITCVFLSGDGDLLELTKELLIHNKMVLAKKELEERSRNGAEQNDTLRTIEF